MLQLLRQSVTRRLSLFLGFEMVALAGSFLFVASWLMGVRWAWGWENPLFLPCAFFVGFYQMCLWSSELYSLDIVYTNRGLNRRVARATGFLVVLMAIVYYLVPGLRIPPLAFVLSTILSAGAIIFWRQGYARVFGRSGFLGNLLLVGNGKGAGPLIEELHERHKGSANVVGILTWNRDEVGKRVCGSRVLGTYQDLGRVVHRHQIDGIVVTSAHSPDLLPMQELLDLKVRGIRIYRSAELFECLSRKVLLEETHPSWLLFVNGIEMTRWGKSTKEVFERVVAFLLLVLSLPVSAVVAALIKLTSEGPVLYVQERVGQNGRMFKLLKFRSMVLDAEKKTGAVWAREDDPRVTLVGKVIRKMRLDEIPQLVNIVRGEMSFVGPRPERPCFVSRLTSEIPLYSQRHIVKPGLSGWAQVLYPYGASVEQAKEKLRYDLYYIKNMSFFFDLLVVMLTAKTVLLGRGR